MVTRVSLQGVNSVLADQKRLGTGYLGLAGKMDAAAAAGNALQGAIAGSLGVGMGAGFIKTVVTTTARIDGLRQGLIGAAGSAAEADMQIRRLEQLAKAPGLGFEQVIEGSIRLQAAGLSAKDAEAALKGFGNALAAVGRGKADLDGVVVALSQILSKGNVSAEEINQIAERVPQIRRVMKDAFGTANTEDLQRMGISSEVFVNRIIDALGKLPPAAKTMQTSFDNLGDATNKFLYGVGGGSRGGLIGVVDAATSGIEAFNGFNTATRGVAGTVLFGAVGVATLATGVAVLKFAWRSVANELWGVTTAANAAAAAQTRAAASGPGGIGGLRGMLGKGGGTMGAASGLIIAGQILSGWGDSGGDAYKKSGSKGSALQYGAGKVLGGAASGAAAGAVLGSIVPGVGNVLGGLIGAAGGAIYGGYSGIRGRDALMNDRSKTSGKSREGTILEQMESHLQKIVSNTSDKSIIGGGRRTANAFNRGDIERAVLRAVV